MMSKCLFLLAFICSALSCAAPAQDKYESGELKGFTRYTAFELVEIATPYCVTRIEGTVTFRGSDDPLPDVLVEIRDYTGRIRSVKTDAHGHFKFGRLPEGTYAFKTTLVGFSSVVGKFNVQKNVDKRSEIIIKMPIGV